jgi:hypothetical protein
MPGRAFRCAALFFPAPRPSLTLHYTCPLLHRQVLLYSSSTQVHEQSPMNRSSPLRLKGASLFGAGFPRMCDAMVSIRRTALIDDWVIGTAGRSAVIGGMRRWASPRIPTPTSQPCWPKPTFPACRSLCPLVPGSAGAPDSNHRLAMSPGIRRWASRPPHTGALVRRRGRGQAGLRHPNVCRSVRG